MKAVIAAAQTGGHINPGLAIANKIKREEPDSEIIFIGTDSGLEADLVPREGYELKTVNCYGLSRSFKLSTISEISWYPIRLILLFPLIIVEIFST